MKKGGKYNQSNKTKNLFLFFYQVIEIDPDLLKLKNLKELTLSANRIADATSENLPPSLKVIITSLSHLQLYNKDSQIVCEPF